MSDPISVLTEVLTTGAVVVAKDTAALAVKDIYERVKSVLANRYGFLSLARLEQKPVEYQGFLKQEIIDSPQVFQDLSLLDEVKRLSQALSEIPPEKLASYGLVADEVKAKLDITIKDISGGDFGAKIRSIISEEGSIELSNIRGRSSGN